MGLSSNLFGYGMLVWLGFIFIILVFLRRRRPPQMVWEDLVVGISQPMLGFLQDPQPPPCMKMVFDCDRILNRRWFKIKTTIVALILRPDWAWEPHRWCPSPSRARRRLKQEIVRTRLLTRFGRLWHYCPVNGWASISPLGGYVVGITRFSASIALFNDSARSHELTHFVQNACNHTFLHDYSWRCRRSTALMDRLDYRTLWALSELQAHFIGSPLAIFVLMFGVIWPLCLQVLVAWN